MREIVLAFLLPCASSQSLCIRYVRREVLRMVLLESFSVAAVGLAVGIPASLAVAATLRSMLYGLTSSTPWQSLWHLPASTWSPWRPHFSWRIEPRPSTPCARCVWSEYAQSREQLRSPHPHGSLSRMTSTAAGMPRGRLATPNTIRTEVLSSPKTSRNSSEAASATFG